MRFLSITFYMILIFSLFTQTVYAGETNLVRSSGKTVLGIDIEGVQLSSEELGALIPFSEGSGLRPELVREGTVNFYLTGLYERVDVLLKESVSGVTVKYRLFPKKWLEDVQFEGNLYLDDSKLLSKIDLRNSEDITDDKLVRNVERLVEYYRFRGFADSVIEYQIVPGADNRTKVIFKIVEGKRGFISDVRLSGDAGISRTKLLSLIASMPGVKLDGEDLDSDLEKVHNHLRTKMYLTPNLTYSVEPAVDFQGAVRVVFKVNKGPYFRLHLLLDDKEEEKHKAETEEEKETKKVSKRMRSVFLKSETPEKAILAMERNLLDRYLKAGYPFTSVNMEDEVDYTGTRDITIRIDRGLKAVIAGLQVEGVLFHPAENINSALTSFRVILLSRPKWRRGLKNSNSSIDRQVFNQR